MVYGGGMFIMCLYCGGEVFVCIVYILDCFL